ncbi:hypothetical protein Ahy_A08g038843 [Arachis hypogaea]|uniref:RNase H type-1 domain-containing protein n=1 Tax=Arachis hypogaea TaxID=3818 RepID=A0A445BUI6_ARAHY|nr:hypothetical protein Ahy_A08g038843 [Arachis hypogaea]
MENLFWRIAEKKINLKERQVQKGMREVCWRPPPADWIKVNVDASLKKNTGKGAIAVVYRNNKGKILLGFTGLIQANSVTVAEALAIRQALIIANNLFMKKVLIESDNLKIIQAIKSKSPIGEAWAIIQDIQLLLKQLPGRGIIWTPREGNLLAHKVAREAELGNLHSNWSMQPPLEILHIMHNETRIPWKVQEPCRRSIKQLRWRSSAEGDDGAAGVDGDTHERGAMNQAHLGEGDSSHRVRGVEFEDVAVHLARALPVIQLRLLRESRYNGGRRFWSHTQDRGGNVGLKFGSGWGLGASVLDLGQFCPGRCMVAEDEVTSKAKRGLGTKQPNNMIPGVGAQLPVHKAKGVRLGLKHEGPHGAVLSGPGKEQGNGNLKQLGHSRRSTDCAGGARSCDVVVQTHDNPDLIAEGRDRPDRRSLTANNSRGL